jgi:hypothetical protein
LGHVEGLCEHVIHHNEISSIVLLADLCEAKAVSGRLTPHSFLGAAA